jgi:hypothetical protein
MSTCDTGPGLKSNLAKEAGDRFSFTLWYLPETLDTKPPRIADIYVQGADCHIPKGLKIGRSVPRRPEIIPCDRAAEEGMIIVTTTDGGMSETWKNEVPKPPPIPQPPIPITKKKVKLIAQCMATTGHGDNKLIFTVKGDKDTPFRLSQGQVLSVSHIKGHVNARTEDVAGELAIRSEVGTEVCRVEYEGRIRKPEGDKQTPPHLMTEIRKINKDLQDCKFDEPETNLIFTVNSGEVINCQTDKPKIKISGTLTSLSDKP